MSSHAHSRNVARRWLAAAALLAAFAAAVAVCVALPGPLLMAAKVHLLAGFALLELALGWVLATRGGHSPGGSAVVGESAQREIGPTAAPPSDEWLVGCRSRSHSAASNEFLGALSEEIWAPLQGVISMLDLIMDSPLGADQRAQLRVARGTVQSLSVFIKDLLDLSLLEQGLVRLAMRPIEVRPLIAGAIDDLRPRAHARSLELVWSADSQLPRLLVADSLRLRQIVSSLAGDAVNRAGSGVVRLSALWQPEAGRLALNVTFSGLAGEGIALRLVRGLAQLHEGDFEITSAAGPSASYAFSMPLRVPAAAPQTDAATASAHSSLSNFVLLVEDNLINQKVVTSLLRKKGYRVDVANHGGEALEMLARRNYRLILMDIQMPVLDGLETTHRIRSSSDWAGLPIIAMTAHAMNGDRERCLDAGMNEYLPKPVDHKLLLELVERYLADADADAGGHPAAPAQAAPPHLPHLMALFNQLAPTRIERLKRAASEGDLAMLGDDASRIQSAARTLSAPGLLACAQSLDEAVHRADLDAIRVSLAGLEAEVSSFPPAPARPPSF